METLSYSDFSQKLHRQVVTQRVPMAGTIEVTRRCPLNCVHYYNRLPMGDREARLNELTYSHFLERRRGIVYENKGSGHKGITGIEAHGTHQNI